MRFARPTVLTAFITISALVLSACTAPRQPLVVQPGATAPNQSQSTAQAGAAKSTSASTTRTARAPNGTYRTVPRYRNGYRRGPYWRYGVGGAVGGAIVGAAIEREIIAREIEREVIRDALTPDPDYDIGGGDWGGGDWGGGGWDDW